MSYTTRGLEGSRNKGFRPKHIFGLVLKEFLNLSDNLKILDLGCGSGFFTRILAEQCKMDITGVNIDKKLLEGARKIAKKEGLDIKYEVGDITNIKFKDNSFDTVMCDIMLEIFKDFTKPLKEMKRVCKAGGIVAAIEPFYKANVVYYPGVDNETRDLLLKFSRADRAFGLGPMLPHYFQTVGLEDIELITWFWGTIGYKTLEFETIQENLQSMKENLKQIKKFLPKSKELTKNEQQKIIHFYEERHKFCKENPDELKTNMSVSGLPVFIVKGSKRR
ncbi:class I SAM-dependent methyltransferase [candidate division WOR-3 bacterium]|nr:class I SAM-dependent methyltransferase [candidate division WOR-3 bacterium]